MWEILYYLLIVAVLAVVFVGGAFFLRAYMAGSNPLEAMSALLGPRPERRLDVVEHANVDGRRKLILVRRDDVEHLLMTGGPVDVVIETGIKVQFEPAAEEAAPQAPSLTRVGRSKGQVSTG